MSIVIEMVGPSGVGKTSIANSLARRIGRRHPVSVRESVRRRFRLGWGDFMAVLRVTVACRQFWWQDGGATIKSLYVMKRRLADLKARVGVVHILDEGLFHATRALLRHIENEERYDQQLIRFLRCSPPNLLVILDGNPASIIARRESRDGVPVHTKQVERDLTSNDRIHNIALNVQKRGSRPMILRINVDMFDSCEECVAQLDDVISRSLGPQLENLESPARGFAYPVCA
jgi:deoxyadenosine/deoxycytidine kinase